MAAIEFILFWAPLAFGVLVAGSYIGTKLALRSYFGGEEFSPSDLFRIENSDGEQ